MIIKAKALVSVIIVTRNRKNELIRCLTSIQASNYKKIEIIIIDNGTNPPVSSWLTKIPKIMVTRSDKNLGAAGGRNIGLSLAKGNFLLFMDDDTKVHPGMIGELLNVFQRNSQVGIVQPKIFCMENKNVLQGIGCNINLLTGRISALGIREKDEGQFDKIEEISTVGCIWMVKKEVINKIGNYDENYFIPYEDLDFSLRARKKGFKILFAAKALAWHDSIKGTYINPWLDYIGIRSTDQAYRIARNKIIFLKKHAPILNLLFFLFFILPMYIVIHSLIILLSNRINLIFDYWKGVIAGLIYVVIGNQNMNLNKMYYKFDEYINPFKVFLLSLEDPVCWIIDKSAKNILDIGCGQGFPMKMIKNRMRVKYCVGVDLFKPYIDIGKKFKIHNKYVFLDVRKINFPKKSFDVVLALQILEHLNKKDAWRLLDKLEKIAKKQIIISTPIGEMYHPAVDDNILQLHKSAFYPEEFKKRGYKIIRYGRKEILGENGIVHKIDNDLFRKLVYGISYWMNICLYLFQPLANYYFVAFKKIK